DVEPRLDRAELAVLDAEAGTARTDHAEPLAAVGVGAAVGHRYCAFGVRARFFGQLVGERVTGPTLARCRAVGVADLVDEAGNDAMEGHAVEVVIAREHDEV